MGYLSTDDGTQIYYKDWGTGDPVVFSHGWPLSSDAWDEQLLFFSENGYRAIAHDRRGHGRSSQPSDGNDMDTYADDLSELMESLDLTNATLVGHSTGGGEIVRYAARYGTRRVARLVLIAAVCPLMMRTETNPTGIPRENFDQFRAGYLSDRSQFIKDIAETFYGVNRDNSQVSQGLKDWFWFQGMQGGMKNLYECIRAFSETDQTDDLKMIDVPTLIIQGDDDQVVPLEISGKPTAQIVRNSKLIIYPGASHGLTATHKEQINADLLHFLKS